MLQRLSWLALGESLAVTLLIWNQAPNIHTALQSAAIPIAGIQIPWLILAVAVGYAFVARILKLHDRISDVFRIRQNFDVSHVLVPLALGSGVALSPSQIATLHRRRPQLMRAAFYTYATSTRPQIDSHEIAMALDQWSWYWACVEAAFIVTLGAIVFATQARFEIAFIFGLILGVLLTSSRPLYASCVRHALSQVEAILADPQRKTAIAQEFCAISR